MLSDHFRPTQVSVGVADGGGILVAACTLAWETRPAWHGACLDLKNFHNTLGRSAYLLALSKLPKGPRSAV